MSPPSPRQVERERRLPRLQRPPISPPHPRPAQATPFAHPPPQLPPTLSLGPAYEMERVMAAVSGPGKAALCLAGFQPPSTIPPRLSGWPSKPQAKCEGVTGGCSEAPELREVLRLAQARRPAGLAGVESADYFADLALRRKSITPASDNVSGPHLELPSDWIDADRAAVDGAGEGGGGGCVGLVQRPPRPPIPPLCL